MRHPRDRSERVLGMRLLATTAIVTAVAGVVLALLGIRAGGVVTVAAAFALIVGAILDAGA